MYIKPYCQASLGMSRAISSKNYCNQNTKKKRGQTRKDKLVGGFNQVRHKQETHTHIQLIPLFSVVAFASHCYTFLYLIFVLLCFSVIYASLY